MSAARPVGPPKKDLRIPALRRFATAITVLNTLGHTILGFETSLLQLFVAVGTAYATEVAIELVSSWSDRRRPAFLGGGWVGLMDFMLPSHISGMALSMLLYPGDRLLPFVWASVIAITSKSLFVAPVKGRQRHYLNPSNTGIAATLLLFPWIAVTPPYHFTENLFGGWDWVLPAVIVCTGSILNTFFTRRMWLILAWLGAFVAQAAIRHLLFDTWLPASLAPMTGVAFLLFTFYMVTDPGTTPTTPRGQLIFGAFLGLIYGGFVALHIQFQLFFALFTVCVARGLILHAVARGWVLGRRRVDAAPVPTGEEQVSRPVAAV